MKYRVAQFLWRLAVHRILEAVAQISEPGLWQLYIWRRFYPQSYDRPHVHFASDAPVEVAVNISGTAR